MPPTTSPPLDEDLRTWLTGQAKWLQLAGAAILQGTEFDSSTIRYYAEQALAEANGTLNFSAPVLGLQSLASGSENSVRLSEISEITGIGQLRPRTPIKFGSTPLAVVYGSNGSGKSSYVRILKHVCGARHKGDLHSDVFSTENVAQGCKLKYYGSAGEATIGWKPSDGVIDALSSIDIFDTTCGHSYLSIEGKATYEPRALQFLAELAALCDKVNALLQTGIDKRPSKLPRLPSDFATTDIGRWFSGINSKTKDEEMVKNCVWTEDDSLVLSELTKTLAERSPGDRAKELRKRKDVIDSLLLAVRDHLNRLSDETAQLVVTSRIKAQEAQKTAELAAKANLESAVLEGVGTKQWSELWTMARRFSMEVAYPDIIFPNVAEESRCILCHQELGEDAKKRLESFDRFVLAEASKALEVAKKELGDILQNLPPLPDDEFLKAKASGGGVEEALADQLLHFYDVMRVRLAELQLEQPPESFSLLPVPTEWIRQIETVANTLDAKAKEFLEGANEKERAVKQCHQKELLARQWIALQKEAADAEKDRHGKVSQLTKAQGLCRTRAISLKKDSLAATLITPAYIAAFNRELTALGAKKIRVELVKTKVSKGAILHQVKLKDAVTNKVIQEILSEGEHRIACLAAFLADSASNPSGSTFVFDDPISSLDLDFEEYVVQRLVKLSTSRPVLVFTHRLSLLGMLRDYSKKAEIAVTTVSIRREHWGAGEPGDEAIESDAPKKGLNYHLPNKIAAAKTVFEQQGTAAYAPFAQSICTEIRKLVERLVEFELLADVVQRHRRAINTMGKLEKLATITPADCSFIEEMMTKYSRYEHAQSREAPVELPEPSELSEDVQLLKDWRDDLEKRRK